MEDILASSELNLLQAIDQLKFVILPKGLE